MNNDLNTEGREEMKTWKKLQNVKNGLELCVGKLPGRKSLCIYFIENSKIMPVGYLNENYKEDVIELWRKFCDV